MELLHVAVAGMFCVDIWRRHGGALHFEVSRCFGAGRVYSMYGRLCTYTRRIAVGRMVQELCCTAVVAHHRFREEIGGERLVSRRRSRPKLDDNANTRLQHDRYRPARIIMQCDLPRRLQSTDTQICSVACAKGITEMTYSIRNPPNALCRYIRSPTRTHGGELPSFFRSHPSFLSLLVPP
ncbi:hypothetical protein CIHG_01670 [Coccidioides immitis H538.4]|uniref:Uncharacterized protein n=3 Tax=Coccidioides immitis TaxID=5501 RepID=A0A0J8R5V9_COCIT|nr:hypothetical protein CIRG_05999 [Coccidioides immitis RMSCC 2394]KMU80479.1 hypothetical protein CISG_02330 [Coccidioides immitis RMSCC 3703]KMU83886.1 hypothetical protein CIHG_01670 [Coccidioides immitis H538.4]